MDLKPLIQKHEAYSAACASCEKPFIENGTFVFIESIEAFIYRLSTHSWFADHRYALCPRCYKGEADDHS